jgi:hypothetical protein
MAGRDRVAALKRARERQRRVEEQLARAVRAHAAVERARAARDRAIERADQRVTDATGLAVHETARLAATCASAEAAAEILDLDVRDVRRAVAASVQAEDEQTSALERKPTRAAATPPKVGTARVPSKGM